MKTYSELLERVNARIAQADYGSFPEELYDPIRYMMAMGGKRLRPVFTLMACDAFSGNVEPALDAALAIEVFHNFTLVHDDIMDNAPLRRGKETVYKKWNMPVAILSGDLMMIRSVDYLLNAPVEGVVKLVRIFNDTAAKVCEGQQIDMNFESRRDVNHEEYIHMISLKTAVLLGGALQIGALIGGASDADASHLYAFGKNIGIAFQIQDDLLDSFGDTAQVGKRIGGDIAGNKKTLLHIELEAVVHKDDRMVLDGLYAESDEEKKIEGILKLYEKYQIRSFAENCKAGYLKHAYAYFDQVNLPAERKNILQQTAHDLMERIS